MKKIFQAAFLATIVASMLAACSTQPTSDSRAERLALVSSEGDSNITVIDLKTEKTVSVLPTGQVPHAMAISPGGKIFVNNRASRELTVIDANTRTVTGSIPLPATSFQLALSPDGKSVAVAYLNALKLSLVDVASATVISTVDVAPAPAAGFKGPMMKHPYWTPDGRFVYVADAVNKTIAKVDIAQGRLAGTIAIDGVNHYLHPSPDGRLLYAINERQGGGTSLILIDSTSDKIVKTLPLALADDEKALGHHGTFTRDGRYFLFCNEGGNRISVLDVAKSEWVKTIKTGKGPGHAVLSPDGTRFFVVHHNDGVITVIDAGALEAVKNIKIGDGDKQSHAAWFTPDGKSFYVVASGDNALVKIDTATLEVASRLPVGKKSMFFAVKDGDNFPSTE